MEIDQIEEIKKLTIIALASDDGLVTSLVLKGGNAIDVNFRDKEKRLFRTSYDIDYSLDNGDFQEDLKTITSRIEATLNQTFAENGYKVFDFKFKPTPRKEREETKDFWGGYSAKFKLVSQADFEKDPDNIEKLRREGIKTGGSTNFKLDFSKFEYVEKKETEYEGYTIYIYPPEMIVFEKVRAICQQMPEYKQVIPSMKPRARARDFYDIYLIMDQVSIDLEKKENIDLIKNIFDSKRVPLELIQKIGNYKHIHSDDWKNVEATVPGVLAELCLPSLPGASPREGKIH